MRDLSTVNEIIEQRKKDIRFVLRAFHDTYGTPRVKNRTKKFIDAIRAHFDYDEYYCPKCQRWRKLKYFNAKQKMGENRTKCIECQTKKREIPPWGRYNIRIGNEVYRASGMWPSNAVYTFKISAYAQALGFDRARFYYNRAKRCHYYGTTPIEVRRVGEVTS